MKRVITLGKRKQRTPKNAFSAEEVDSLINTLNETLGGLRQLGQWVAQHGSEDDLRNLQEARQVLMKIPAWFKE